MLKRGKILNTRFQSCLCGGVGGGGGVGKFLQICAETSFFHDCSLFFKPVTCNGVLTEASFVKPTMSLKNIVTSSNSSACTELWLFNCSSTKLKLNNGLALIRDLP